MVMQAHEAQAHKGTGAQGTGVQDTGAQGTGFQESVSVSSKQAREHGRPKVHSSACRQQRHAGVP